MPRYKVTREWIVEAYGMHDAMIKARDWNHRKISIEKLSSKKKIKIKKEEKNEKGKGNNKKDS